MRQAALLAMAMLAATVAAEDKQVSVKESGFGCRTTDDTRKFYNLAVQDKQAASLFSVQNGCRIFKPGEMVWITDPAPLSGMNGVRPQGDPNTYYVPRSVAS